MIYIINFTISRDLEDIKYSYDHDQGTNLDNLFQGFADGNTEWSVPQKAEIGDIVVFMCAKEARHNLGLATSHAPANYGDAFFAFVDQQKAMYKQYSGCLLGYGIVNTMPEIDASSGWYFAEIDKLKAFPLPIYIDEFRSFISISTWSSVTYLQDEQWERLKWQINQKNPKFFSAVTPPDADILKEEYEKAVRKAEKKSITQLKRAAEKKSLQPSLYTVTTQMYYRDPIIGAYVKKRANGYCQLCNEKAPFIDQNGEPYLECHHIEWLSKGGMDSIDNCVALCPNCHRKMHMLNDSEDIKKLKAKI